MGHLPHIPSIKSSLGTELLGTFLLVLIGTSALTALNVAGQATTSAAILVGTLAFSAAIGWLTYTFYRFPLPQFNPAVTLLFWIQGLQPISRSLMIIIMQLLGAVTASVVVALLYGSAGVEVRLGAPYPATLMGGWAALIAEFIGSLIALYAIQSALNRQRLVFFNPFLLISLGYGLGYLLSAGISGGALNPARALAPQLAAADLTGWWAYIAGPVFAAAALGLLARRATALKPSVSFDQPETSEDDKGVSFDPKSTPSPALAVANQAHAKGGSDAENKASDEPEVSPSQLELQQKAQLAIDKLKHSKERPKLPFAAAKPSFYPLAGNKTEANDSDEIEASPDMQPCQPSGQPAASDPKQAAKPDVKFINFELSPLDEENE